MGIPIDLVSEELRRRSRSRDTHKEPRKEQLKTSTIISRSSDVNTNLFHTLCDRPSSEKEDNSQNNCIPSLITNSKY